MNFPIGAGREPMPEEIIRAFAVLKKAAAAANRELKPEKMTAEKYSAIRQAAEEILAGKLDGHFPLVVWQTGSGTQSNMNVNEVIANRGNEIAGEKLLHPNDDVNMSQSSNDTFPTAMHIAAARAMEQAIGAAVRLKDEFVRLEKENAGALKCGRTHLQDATPILFSQEISGWRASLEKDAEMLRAAEQPLLALALGGTAVGTGLNAPAGFDTLSAEKIAEETGLPFRTAENKFHALTSRDEMVFAHGALKALAADLMKIANDIRWLASGPRLGLGEITIPENEPGSQGNFELNVFMPVCAYNFLQSARLLAESMDAFRERCVSGIRANREKMQENVDRSLMLVTALSPRIGYENAAKTAQKAHREGMSLKEACLALGLLTAEEFDECFHPERMV